MNKSKLCIHITQLDSYFTRTSNYADSRRFVQFDLDDFSADGFKLKNIKKIDLDSLDTWEF